MSRSSGKVARTLSLCAVVVAALSSAAHADVAKNRPKPVRPHSHARSHIYFQTIFVPGMVVYPRPLPPRTIYAPPAQTVYVEKKDLENGAGSEAGNVAYAWYFCQPLQIYYPYTLDCPEPWVRVTPPAEPDNTDKR